MTDIDWLVTPDKRKLTANRYTKGNASLKQAANKPHLIEPVQGFIMHYTASGNCGSTIAHLCDAASVASAHFVIDRDGTTWQLAPLSDRTWHAGGATSEFLNKRNTNGRTIGIEIMNWGVLTRDDDKKGWLNWVDDAARKAKKSYNLFKGNVTLDPKQPQRKAWETYPDVQIVAVCELVAELAKLYPHVAADPDKFILGHEDVDAMRKTDPGAAFPWSTVRDTVRPPRGPVGCTLPG